MVFCCCQLLLAGHCEDYRDGAGFFGSRVRHIQNFIRRAGGVAQVIEHLPSKLKALTSNPNTISPQNYFLSLSRYYVYMF
jgi:hypothetical protein